MGSIETGSVHGAEKRNGFVQAPWRSRSQPVAPAGRTHGAEGPTGPKGRGPSSCGTAEHQQKRLTTSTRDFWGTESIPAIAATCPRRSQRVLPLLNRAKEINPSKLFHVLLPVSRSGRHRYSPAAPSHSEKAKDRAVSATPSLVPAARNPNP